MRYKFRGKRVDNGEWVYGDLHYGEEPGRVVFIFDYTYRSYVAVIPETVGQWTGFLDEKGREVYEGDILLAGIVGEAFRMEVFWNEELGCWDMRDDEDLSYFDIYRGLSPFQTHDFRIIGNKWDNPDLLKGGR